MKKILDQAIVQTNSDAPDATGAVETIVQDHGTPPPAPRVATPDGKSSANVASILGPLLGGAIAAVAGFALSHFDAFGLRIAPDKSETIAEQDQTEQGLENAKAEIAALQAEMTERLAAMETKTSVPPDLSDLTAIEARLAALETLPTEDMTPNASLSLAVADLTKRVDALATGAGLPSELSARVDAGLKRLADAEAAATANARKAANIVEASNRANAVRKLESAIASGKPFTSELESLLSPDLPAVLTTAAVTGVRTLEQLKHSFPDAARTALLASRAARPDIGWGERALDFLKEQAGARPLMPLNGTDAEAILSRADAAVSEGRVADALIELDGLDPVAAAPLANWTAAAEQNVAVEASLRALASTPSAQVD